MNKNNVLIGLFTLLNLYLTAQEDTIAQRIILIGDAGQLVNGKHPVVDAVRKKAILDKKTSIIFLGDNLYRSGLPDDQSNNYAASRAILDSQLSIADGTPSKVFMIPGNHDWENSKRGGFEAIIRQQLYVDFSGKKNVKYYPEDGCPGPVEVSLGNDVTLIIFDSQWWLHPYDKPEIESDCNYKTKDELVTQIGDIAARNSKKLIVIACHHPFKSNGTHGTYYTLKQHIFPFTDIKKSLYIPLPVIGSAYPISRSVFGALQDLQHPIYANMIKEVTAVVRESASNVIFVSGHDHNLQHIIDSNFNYIVSGSGGGKENRTSKRKNSLYNSPDAGYGVLEISKNKNVTLDFYIVKDTIRKDYTATLLNFSKLPASALDTLAQIITDPYVRYKDTITIAASKNFPIVKGLKKFFMGQNYRQEWSTPVNMKVFKISQEKGGFTILSLGGGKQTKSLRLRDKNGKEWVLRSINKNSTKAVPEDLRGTVAEDLVAEMNSASNPYAALVVPPLAEALNLTVPQPELFFVPDDPAFGYYRKIFANNICMLEERKPSLDGIETKTTSKVFDKMLDENDHQPDQPVVLRARLLDIVLGDFDRHFDQWRWGTTDTGKGKIYYPIPRDRDQALFYSDGLMLKLVSGNAMPFLKGFRSTIPKINWLGYTARDFDRIFLADLDADDWKKSIAFVQRQLSDSVIRAAVNKMPHEVQGISGETIINKMISRRDLISKNALTYYRFISKQVNIIGSNQKEYFKVSNVENGLQIRVYARSKGNDTSFIMYNRVFQAGETKEIRLFGLNDDDIFEIDKDASSRIKIRIIGGRGNDTFDIKGHVETLLYDITADGNFIKNNSNSKNRFSKSPPVNDRNIIGFKYNTTKFPQLQFALNSDDGFMIGSAFSRRTYGFRNLPYASDQKLSVLYGVTRKAYQFRYRGEFNHISRKTDLVVQANFASPSLRNFFGLGNNTKVEQSVHSEFYQTRYKSFELEALFRKRLVEKVQFLIGPYLQSYDGRFNENKNNVLSRPQQVGLDSADIFSKKFYLGGKIGLHLDNRNNEIFPTRGMLWTNEFISVAGIKKGSDNYTGFTSNMSLYASFSDPAKLVMVLKIGGGRIFSKNYEYFQAMNFGSNNDLKGFRKNRFAGTSTFYSGLEMRVKLFDVNSFILPGTLGVTGFYDIGRVWLKNESSKAWHGGYGAGLYFIPFNLFVISASAGFSENEKMLNFSIGAKVNITY
jgi:Omp85 superfamily domain/Calcineurin-like phosphoesterase